MKISNLISVMSDYARAEFYAVSSIRRASDVHLLWGPAYARMVCGIGARNFSLYSLAGVPRKTWANYLANEPLKKKYAAITPKDARVLADDKLRFFEHCHHHGLDTAKVLTLITPIPYDGGLVPHSFSPDELAALLVPGEYFIKPSNGSHGQGAFSLLVTQSGLAWAGNIGSFADFFLYCRAALQHTQSLIVQPKLINHEAIRNFTHAKGLSTIRVVTVRKSGSIQVIGACMRIIVGESEVDNFSHGAGGNLLAAVDIDTGFLITARGSNSKAWPKMSDIADHPVSGMPIVGFELPFWTELLALARKAHDSIEFLHTVGWDIAITDHGPVIVEANWRYDIDILQVAYKAGYKRIIDENVAA